MKNNETMHNLCTNLKTIVYQGVIRKTWLYFDKKCANIKFYPFTKKNNSTDTCNVYN